MIDKLTDKLEKLYLEVHNCLKFAEQKNGAFLVLNSTILALLMKLFIDNASNNSVDLFYCLLMSGFACVWVLLILSFLPSIFKLNFVMFFSPKQILDNNSIGNKTTKLNISKYNLLYYKDISRCKEDYFNDLLCDQFGYKTEDLQPYDKLLMKQIWKLSRIGTGKFTIFAIAASLDAFLIAVFVITLLIVR